VRDAIAEQNLPGLSVAVGVDGTLAWAEGFGYADIDKHTTVTPHTRLRIGTLSIPLTAAAAGLLVDRNRLNLDEEIQAHVPEFPKKKWPITLRQVMGHLSGLPSDGGDEGPLFGQHCERPVDAFPAFASRELLFEPGTAYRYSRYGFIVVSAAIEAAADDNLQRFMRKEIFDPLAMSDTVADSTTETIDDRATSYFPRFAADPKYGPDPMRDIDLSCYSGSSVFMSTASDLVRFEMALNGGKLLQPGTVEQLQRLQRRHDGDLLGGIVASLMTRPDQKITVAAISNTSYADTPGLVKIIADAFGK
jgi:CubicO group peptidase (beta-lactamase class C family)